MANIKGFAVWLTGLSGSGKTTISLMLRQRLMDYSFSNVEVLDGDIIRENLSSGLGFSKEDRIKNIKRVGYICNLLTRNNIPVIAALISPIRNARKQIRFQIKNFVEVYVKCSLAECERRDVKGLYKKARSGNLTHFTGIDSPYEPPLNPEVTCDTELETPEKSTIKIIKKLKELNYIKQNNS